jgi:hypothetical protein
MVKVGSFNAKLVHSKLRAFAAINHKKIAIVINYLRRRVAPIRRDSSIATQNGNFKLHRRLLAL